MLFRPFLIVTGFVNAAVATYYCSDNLGNFQIQDAWARNAVNAGGTTSDCTGSRFPHSFGGMSGPGAISGSGKTTPSSRLKFYGADPRCNEQNPMLLEYPIPKDGSTYKKNSKTGVVSTPARVVYLSDGTTLCGVMTHVTEDADDHHGSGPFRVCDSG